jgi:hypothetical protein
MTRSGVRFPFAPPFGFVTFSRCRSSRSGRPRMAWWWTCGFWCGKYLIVPNQLSLSDLLVLKSRIFQFHPSSWLMIVGQSSAFDSKTLSLHMRGRQTHIFATPGDLVPIVQEAMMARPIRLYLTGVFERSAPIEIFDPAEMLPSERYLIVDYDTAVGMDRFELRRGGGTRYSLDQGLNRESIILATSGFHTPTKLLPGTMDTIGEGPRAVELYKLFAKLIRKRFEKIQEYYVGPEAAAALDSGSRLASTSGSPASSDLVRKLISPKFEG